MTCNEAETLAMPGRNESGLEAVTVELERFIRTLAERAEEASDACYRAATEFADAFEQKTLEPQVNNNPLDGHSRIVQGPESNRSGISATVGEIKD